MTDRDRTGRESFDVDEDDLRRRLTDEEYRVTREGETERAFTGAYWDHHGDGTYRCVVCDEALFSSTAKYDSGSGWPSFREPADGDAVVDLEDRSHGMVRTEVRCTRCGSHLGHVFPDGPRPTGRRYCINSAALNFRERSEDGGPESG